MDERTLSVAGDVVRGLERLVRDLLARKAGGHLVESSLERLPLELELGLVGPGADPARRGAALVESIDRLLDDVVEEAASFRPGRAYCHRCRTPACDHAVPPSSRHVFAGYAPTGLPRWEDFAQLCLDERHEEVDRLYDDPPALLSLAHGPERLHGALLGAFENPSALLLGQLVTGFFRVRADAGDGRGVVALTFQVAAARARRGAARIGLNILGRAPGGGDLGSLWDAHRDLPWRRGVRWAQAALRTLPPPRVADDPATISRVDGILRGLGRRMEREQRSRSRRTLHAEERHDSGRRPTRMALEDARAAAPEAFLVDERHGTLVVLGERGRTHIFTPEGRLVSSVRYSREAIDRKIKRGIWRDATVEEGGTFLASLKSSSGP